MPLPVFGVGKPDSRRILAAGRAIVPNIRPEPCRLGSAFAGREDRQWGVIGMKLGTTQHIAPDRFDQWREQFMAMPHPVSEQRAIQIQAATRINGTLPVERQVIAELADQHVGQQGRAGDATWNRA